MPATTHTDPLADLLGFPLLDAMFGRRARRFGLGMEVPSGPLAFTSRGAPAPLTDLERSVLVAAGTGVTAGASACPSAPIARRLTRTTRSVSPDAPPRPLPVRNAGAVLHRRQRHVLTNTRDSTPTSMREFDDGANDAEQLMAVCPKHTTQLSHERLDLPAARTAHAAAQPVDGQRAGIDAVHARRRRQ